MPLLGSRGAGSAKGFGLTAGGVKPVDFDYLVVAGGGGGFQGLGGGGGAGGLRTSFPGGTKTTINKKNTTITVGAGGAPNPQPSSGPARIAGHGVDSSIGSNIISAGGGVYNDGPAYGPPGASPENAAVRDGGSGAGQSHQQTGFTGLGNVPPVSPPQGNPGGPGGGSFGSSGGGGAGGAGVNGQGSSPNPSNSGPGGPGVANSISGSPVTYAGGGGGGAYVQSGGSGGPGGGGAGGNYNGGAATNGTAGTVNTGGGGGAPNPAGTIDVGGGSGIIYLRVPTANAPAALAVSPGTNTITIDGSDKVLTFTVSGTLTI
jgi:hypothetical protein